MKPQNQSQNLFFNLKNKFSQKLFSVLVVLPILSQYSSAAVYNIVGGTPNFGAYVSALGTPFPAPQCGDVFNISCNAILDEDFYFPGCTFNVDAGFGMTLNIYIKVIFDKCIANTTSSTTTWLGIYAGFPSNGIKITNSSTCTATSGSIFSNMDHGVVCENGARLDCDNTYFYDNDFALSIKNAPTGSYPGIIENNHFVGTNTMLINSLGTYSYCGLYIDNVSNSSPSDVLVIGGQSIGQPNYFGGSMLGVINKNANIDIQGNVFRGIGYSAAAGITQQTGIFIQNLSGSVVVCNANSFYDSYSMGVWCSAVESTIEIGGNYFTSVLCENIFLFECDGSSIKVSHQNVCHNWGGAANLYFGVSQVAIRATNNQTLGIGTATTLLIFDNALFNTGIRIGILVDEPGPSPLYNLTINANKVIDVRRGITVSNIFKSWIGYNYCLIHWASGAPSWGIRTNSCPYTTYYNNEIHGDGFTNINQYGIAIVRCLASVAFQNYVWDVGTNFYTWGNNNDGTTYLCNDLENGTTGFYFFNVPTFGPGASVGSNIDPSDNVWGYNVAWTGTWDIFRTGPAGGVNVDWYYRPSTCPAGTYYTPASIFNAPWLVVPNAALCNPSSCSPPYLIANPGYDEREFFFGNAVNVLVDSINISSAYFEQVYDAYIFLKLNPDWLSIGTDDQDYIDFVDAMDAGVLGNFYRSNYFSRFPDSLTYAQDELDNISPANDWEQVWKDVIQVYLNTWAVGVLDFDIHYQSVLDDAVSHSVNEYGPGVMMAHVMLGSEEELDTVPNPYRFEGFPEDDNIVYPNPNTGDFQLNVNGPLTFELYDVAGRLLFNKIYPDIKVNIQLPEYLLNGTYLYKVILTENGFSKSGLMNLFR